MAAVKRPSGGRSAQAYVGWGLVDRVVRDGGVLQPLDLVLDHQLAALQLANLEVVYGGVHEGFVQFVLEYFVFTLQLNEMGLYCHCELSSVR
jgi:hypothetical protein